MFVEKITFSITSSFWSNGLFFQWAGGTVAHYEERRAGTQVLHIETQAMQRVSEDLRYRRKARFVKVNFINMDLRVVPVCLTITRELDKKMDFLLTALRHVEICQ